MKTQERGSWRQEVRRQDAMRNLNYDLSAQPHLEAGSFPAITRKRVCLPHIFEFLLEKIITLRHRALFCPRMATIKNTAKATNTTIDELPAKYSQ